MATHDYVIDNQTAPNFRADLNNALLAIVSNNSSATAPAVTYANMMWYDTAANILYMRNEDNDAWIRIGTLDQTADTFAAAVSLASQAEAETGTDNTKVMTPLRVAQSVVANVGGATAGLAFGAIGTYAFLVSNATDTRTLVPGDTVLGSSVRFGGVNRSAAYGASANDVSVENGNETGLNINTAVTVVGTWRMMGNPRSLDTTRGFGTIALRIA